MVAPGARAFHVDGSSAPRPPSARTILADGADAETERRPGDIELSHWVPNATDVRYKADTSTEICLRYVADPDHVVADLVVNDHVDVDGILALFALTHPEPALAHRETLVGAASMGDFLAWADRLGFVIAQEVWRAVSDSEGSTLDPNARYELAFGVVSGLLDGSAAEHPDTTAGWTCIEAGLALLDAGTVTSTVHADRLVSFVFPPTIEPASALGVPSLNQLVDGSIAVWPQVRNREHGERVQLLSVPAPAGGWMHDVWAPAYSWAETPDRWPLPGLVSTGDSNRWLVQDPRLDAAVAALGDRERGAGSWRRAEQLTPFTSLAGRGFPVIVSCVDDDGHLAPSTLEPEAVADLLAPVWTAGR